MTAAEWLLLAALAGFYCYDTSLLLFSGEVLFSQRRGRWQASVGSEFMLAGRFLALTGLFDPGTPVFRASWQPHSSPAPVPAPAPLPSPETLIRRLRPLRWPCRVLGVLLFAGVPWALLRNWSDELLLVLLLPVYAITIGSAVFIAMRRQMLGLGRASVAAIALEIIACPPLALNTVRKVTLRRATGPAEAFATRVLDAPALRTLAEAAGRRIALARGQVEDG